MTSISPEEIAGLQAALTAEGGDSIDELQVAARLESLGFTDDLVQRRYRHPDVFSLASELLARHGVDERPEFVPARRPEWDEQGASRVLHGVLYLLPALAMPALLSVMPVSAVIPVLMVGASMGWVCSGVLSWVAYSLRGDGHPGGAALVMNRLSLLVGLLSVAVGLVAGWRLGVGLAGAALCSALVCYQLGTTQLVFLGHRWWVGACSLPAGITGVWYLSFSGGDGNLVVICYLTGTLAMQVLAWWFARAEARQHIAGEGRVRLGPHLAAIVGYSCLSAGYLLSAQSQLILGGFDVAVGLVGLIVTAGLVEWRAVLVGGGCQRLLALSATARQFRYRLFAMLVCELGIVIGASLAVGLVCCLLIASYGRLSVTGVVVFVAAAVLSGAYLLIFALANMGAYRAIILVLAVGFLPQLVIIGRGATIAAVTLLTTAVLMVMLQVSYLCVQELRDFY